MSKKQDSKKRQSSILSYFKPSSSNPVSLPSKRQSAGDGFRKLFAGSTKKSKVAADDDVVCLDDAGNQDSDIEVLSDSVQSAADVVANSDTTVASCATITAHSELSTNTRKSSESDEPSNATSTPLAAKSSSTHIDCWFKKSTIELQLNSGEKVHQKQLNVCASQYFNRDKDGDELNVVKEHTYVDVDQFLELQLNESDHKLNMQLDKVGSQSSYKENDYRLSNFRAMIDHVLNDTSNQHLFNEHDWLTIEKFTSLSGK